LWDNHGVSLPPPSSKRKFTCQAGIINYLIHLRFQANKQNFLNCQHALIIANFKNTSKATTTTLNPNLVIADKNQGTNLREARNNPQESRSRNITDLETSGIVTVKSTHEIP